MRKYKEIMVLKKTISGCICDICGNESTEDMGNVSMMHQEWGNDSVDSIEEIDYCSSACYAKAAIKFLKDFSGYKSSATFDNVSYKNIKALIDYDAKQDNEETK